MGGIWGVSQRMAWVMMLASGCGGGSSGAEDAGASPDASAEGGIVAFEPEPPLPPELPRMTPCPPGWREVPEPAVDGLVICEPWPEGGRQACAVDEAHFLGEPGCARIGPPCPAGIWPEGLPEGSPVIYVDPTAETGGDGTIARPFATIARALTTALPGDVIALAKGRYREAVFLDLPVTLWGACVAETWIAPSGPFQTTSTIFLQAGAEGAVVKNARVGGGVDLRDARAPGVLLESIVVDGADTVGLLVRRSVVTSRDVVVRDVVEGDGEYGICVDMSEDSTLDLERLIVEGCDRVGIMAADGARGTLRDVVITDVGRVSSARGAFNRALELHPGSAMGLERVVVEGCRGSAVKASADTTASDVIVRDQEGEDGFGGLGLVIDGGTQRWSRLVLDRTRGRGLAVQSGTATVMDLVVRDTRAEEASGFYGVGAGTIGGTLELERATLLRNRVVGLSAAEGSSVRVRDLIVLDTLENGGGTDGYGAQSNTGATLELERVLLGRNREAGVRVRNGATLTALDLEVIDTRSSDWTGGRLGTGVEVVDGTARVERLRIEGSRGYGVMVARGSLQGREVSIRGTAPYQCGESCPESSAGAGAAAWEAGILELEAFSIRDSALMGLQLLSGEVDLHHGEIVGNPIGVNLQATEYDLGRLQDDVRYDNERNFDSLNLPVPNVSREWEEGGGE